MQYIALDFVRESYLDKLTSNNRLVGLIGQRGVGKTTLLLQYLKTHYQPTEYLYFSADDVHITNSSIYDIAEEFVRLGGQVIAIDEIHKYHNWAQEIKSIYDSFPGLMIRFSGSSMVNILNEKYDLSRRCVTSYVKPLSFREFYHLHARVALPSYNLETILKEASEISSSLALANPTLYKSFLKYLQIGFYPFFKEDEEAYKNKLFNACEKVINEDIPSLNKLDYTHIGIFKKFIAKLIYARVPYKVNISALSQEFGISHPTLSSYLAILEQTKLIKPIRKYSTKISKKPEKLLFGNTNLLYTYADEFGIEVDIGTVRETYFASCFESIYYSDVGDFRVGDKIFEIGGKNKSFKQIKDLPDSYVVVDTDYVMEEHKIPLWLFGLMK
jgi:predicted AAA+ superfamily ATPase